MDLAASRELARLSPKSGIKYSKEEDAYLLAYGDTTPHRELAANLGRNIRSIESRIGKLFARRFKIRPFTPEEDAAIREGFGKQSSGEIARRFGRDPAVIRSRAKTLGLGPWKRPLKDYYGYKVNRIEITATTVRRVPEHRHIMEQHLGRRLTDEERVHHVNFEKRDNRIDNLFLCENGSVHSKAHHSVNAIIMVLLKRGDVIFDREQGVYRFREAQE